MNKYIHQTFRYTRDALGSLVRRFGYELVPRVLLYEWQKGSQGQPSHSQSRLPEDATTYLQQSNPILKDLQARYSAFDQAVTAPLVWTDNHVRPDDILYFRGDNAYVWQLRGFNMNPMSYALTTFYVKSIDKLGLLNSLLEDDYFGNFTFNIDNRIISRDLLDSIIHFYFLDSHLHVSSSKDLTILDIGAGYGRLAHRMVSALPQLHCYLCTDAVAVSTFISEYYLRFRGIEDRARVIPLDMIEHTLKSTPVQLALNIHSFSECRLSAIDWWLSLLSKYRVRHLMISPNALDHGGEQLRTNDGLDFAPMVEKHGYKLVAKDPKYGDPVVQIYGINPTYHHLFELC